MNNIYQFMSDSPWLTFFLELIIAGIMKCLLGWPFRLINHWIRHRNIVAQGWPPSHLDADGDYHFATDAEKIEAEGRGC